MAIAPTSVKVMVLPQDKREFRYETLQTVRTDIRPSKTTPDSLIKMVEIAEQFAKQVNLLYYLNESTPQPNVSLLPDFGKAYWGPEAWEQRGAHGTAKHHIFFTLSNSEELAPNPNMANIVKGDAFIVKLSDTKDEKERKFYVDLEPGDVKPEEILELIFKVAEYPKR